MICGTTVVPITSATPDTPGTDALVLTAGDSTAGSGDSTVGRSNGAVGFSSGGPPCFRRQAFMYVGPTRRRRPR